MTEDSHKAGATAWYAVVLLGALYIVAFVDRVILALLVAPLKEEFGVSDTQISLLIGFNFALFYALVGLPMGRLADRVNRRNLILASTAVWAACTFLSGTATAFWVLCVLRIGVAVGEAALSPSAISMIGDLFPRDQRGRATALYMAMGATGATGGYILGGHMVGAIGQHEMIAIPFLGDFKPWQTVFIAVASPAILLAGLMLATLREPPRLSLATEPAPSTRPFAWATRLWRPLLLLFVAGSTGQTMVHGMGTWAPTYIVREFGWQIGQAGVRVGVVTMVGGVGGMIIWPLVTEWWTRRGRPDALPLVLTFGLLAGAAMMIAAALAPSALLFLAAYALAMFFLMGTGVLLMVAIQIFAHPTMRGELMAVCLLLTALIALGLGPTLVPLIGGWIGGPDDNLRSGFVAVALLTGPLAALVVHIARPGLLRLRREGWAA